jgi:hypothetical protein
MNLFDKNGVALHHDDVMFDGVHYYRIYDKDDVEVEAISCTDGYMHDIKQEDITNFERIGTYVGNEKLFECD